MKPKKNQHILLSASEERIKKDLIVQSIDKYFDRMY